MLLSIFLAILASTAHAGQLGKAALANGVYLNSDGAPIIPLIESARRSLDIEVYTMNDPEVRTLIRSAMARGVRVRIIKEPNPYGQSCNIFQSASTSSSSSAATSSDCKDQQRLVKEVRASGGVFEPFNKQALCPNGGGKGGQGCYEHGKIAVADGSVALISTGNFDTTNLCIDSENPSRCNRDFSLIENDPTLVSTLEDLFQTDLQGQSYDVRTHIPSSLNHLLTVSPYSLQPLIDFINTAQSTIDIEAQYLHDPELNAALIAAARRGVRIRATLSSVCAFGKPSAWEVNETQKIFTSFDKVGIATEMFNSSNEINGHPGYMHAKVIVVDGTRAWVGSQNGSTESLTENREYGLVFDRPEWVQKVLAVTKSDFSSPNSETWQQSLNCEKDGSALGAKIPERAPKKPIRRKRPTRTTTKRRRRRTRTILATY